MTSRPSTAGRLATIALAVFALMVLPSVYVGGYVWMGKFSYGQGFFDGNPEVERNYSYGWQVLLFSPAGHLESKARGIRVILSSPYRGNTIYPVDDDGDFWK